MADDLGELGELTHAANDGRDAPRRHRSARPYRPPAKVHFAMYATSTTMVMIAVLMIVGGDRTWWTWIFPAAAVAGAVYGYLHVRSATTPGRGFAWVMVQVVCSLGAYALLFIPGRY